MKFFHFKDEGDLEAHIFAWTRRRAAELFLIYLLSNGGDANGFMWRELELEHLDEPDCTRLREALALEIEGVATRDRQRGWIPVPLVVQEHLDEP
jgi:hypothetical protein